MNKEQVYDTQIAPLMSQIIALCKAHEIPMVASFHIPNNVDPNLNCTTALALSEWGTPDRFGRAVRVLRREPLMVTVQQDDGTATYMTICD